MKESEECKVGRRTREHVNEKSEIIEQGSVEQEMNKEKKVL